MKVYYIKVGDNRLGPFQTKAAAAAEAKALEGKGFTVSVVQRTESENAMFEALGNPEAEVELDDDDDIDFDEIFGDGDDDEGDDDEGDDGDGDDDEGDDGENDEGDDDDADDDSDSDDADEDEAPSGVHGWFKSWGKQ